MWSRLCTLAIILTVVSLGGAVIEQIHLPDTFSRCLQQYSARSNGSAATFESIDYYCIQRHRMQLMRKSAPQNISADTTNWINELLRMSEVDKYENEHIERYRRQVNIEAYATTETPLGSIYQIPPAVQFAFPSSGTQDEIDKVYRDMLSRQQVGTSSSQDVYNNINIDPATIPQQPSIDSVNVVSNPSLGINNAQTSQQQNFPQMTFPQQQQQPQQTQTQNQFPQQPQAQQPQIQNPFPQQQQTQGQQQQPRRLRVRKEYRRMSDQERNDFHRAIIMLKRDTSVAPNRYDALGIVHFNLVNNIHHGSAFLPWHRTFITIFENALRQKVPTVALPYWDSTLDEAMMDPTQSILFSPAFVGNGNGLVTTGPFAYFQTPSGPLIRNIGQGTGSLFSRQEIRNILSRTRLEEISEPNADTLFNVENYHGDVHTWLGGEMEPMETSAFDPLFYVHHCFVDYVWEIFRTRQRAVGIDPTRDYPSNFGPSTHSPFARMGFGDLRNAFGLSDMFTTQIYTYEQNPSCTFSNPSCNTPYLNCDMSQGLSLCVPRATGVSNLAAVNAPTPGAQLGNPMNMNAPFGGAPGMPGPPVFGRRRRSAEEKKLRREARKKQQLANLSQISVAGTHTCTGTWLSFSSQNTFEVNGKSDTRKWVFIPVRVISKRSPEHRKFQAFPIYNGHPSKKHDIYNPESYPEISPYFTEEVMPSSSKCTMRQADRTVGRVHIRSNGLNYVGNYEEYVVVDLRQAFTESTTYIALKEPRNHTSEVLLTAYDSCGRRCKPYCLNSDPQNPGYSRCSGAIRVTDETPWMYGKNYGDSVRISWKLRNLDDIPELKTGTVFIQFFCDHNDNWVLT